MKVYIDPSSDILYSSYYIKGIEELFGKKNIKFSNNYFRDFKHNNHFFALVLKSKDAERKIIIDFADSEEVDIIALNWADTYAKINKSDIAYPSPEKIIAIGPSFGIHIYSFFKTGYMAISNYLKASSRIPNKRRFFSDYKAQLNRMSIDEYYPNKNVNNYVFFASSLWKKEKKTNDFRANFIKACIENPDIEFDGGFAPRPRKDVPGYDEITVTTRYSITEYLGNMKKSSIAFNTPAVLDCHGWKLGEFLCFGKAIISTPLSRKLPKALQDRKHLLFTDGSQDDIQEKIKNIIVNPELLTELKNNARKYYEEELSPKKVIERITKATFSEPVST
ncbi:hypothetical protein SAMN04489724_4769 [Algoriphagus locisalis]|uniref:Glycosyl transferases group 1 n=1 Tax=Algoriphagus locisalis TaxID=305507 RepID=A0A1I7E2G8_9BACT|nr:glycosyltransferase [Algoriphagus locisalis]SFU18117.1 hypothetical protein SAMN04489724_4769 [Algoriphagus locisalis]